MLSRIKPAFQARRELLAACVLLCSANASADQGFAANLDRILREHQLVRMVDADVETAREQVNVEKAAYYPKLTVNAGAGRRNTHREEGTDGHYDPVDASVGLNQLITDFGATSSRVQAAKVVLVKEEAERELQVQNLILAAIEAQLQVIQAERTQSYARQSEQNIKQQTSLENARMEAGRGYATDVLQAKSQLAGAEARRVMADSRMRESLNRYRVIFGESAIAPDTLEALAIPSDRLPASEAAIVESVRQQNPDLLAAIKRAEVTLAERDAARSKELMPRLSFRLSQEHYEDYDDTPGFRNDTKAMVNFDWQFDLGMRANYVTRAADQAVASAQEKADYVRIQAMEEARNAWVSWETSRERADHLRNQVRIAESFLELARKEREMGRRSLLDILNGEVGLINAQSDATAAGIDEIIAAYRLLRATGQLSPGIFRQPGIIVPAERALPVASLAVGQPSTN